MRPKRKQSYKRSRLTRILVWWEENKRRKKAKRRTLMNLRLQSRLNPNFPIRSQTLKKGPCRMTKMNHKARPQSKMWHKLGRMVKLSPAKPNCQKRVPRHQTSQR